MEADGSACCWLVLNAEGALYRCACHVVLAAGAAIPTLFCSVLFCSVRFFSVRFCSVLFSSLLFSSVLRSGGTRLEDAEEDLIALVVGEVQVHVRQVVAQAVHKPGQTVRERRVSRQGAGRRAMYVGWSWRNWQGTCPP